MSFADQLQIFINATKEEAVGFVKDLTKEGFSTAVEHTPIRTKAARDSWRVNCVDLDETYEADRGDVLSEYDQQGTGGLKLLPEENERQKERMDLYTIGDLVYISNNIPYAEALDSGNPPASPQNNHMHEKAVGDMVSFAELWKPKKGS